MPPKRTAAPLAPSAGPGAAGPSVRAVEDAAVEADCGLVTNQSLTVCGERPRHTRPCGHQAGTRERPPPARAACTASLRSTQEEEVEKFWAPEELVAVEEELQHERAEADCPAAGGASLEVRDAEG